LISKYVSRGTILDYGAGTGAFLKSCMEEGWIVTGIEPNEGARSSALKREIHAFTAKKNCAPLTQDNLTRSHFWHVLDIVSDLHEPSNILKCR